MTTKQVESPEKVPVPPAVTAPADPVKFGGPTDEDMAAIAQMRASSEPWKSRGETTEQSLEALTKLRPFVQVARLNGSLIGYVTVERDGPVPGAAYMRNIVVRGDLRRKGYGHHLLDEGMRVARELLRKTIALRVDPANSVAVSFYRNAGFTTVATVVSKKSGKLRLLMSKDL